MTSLQTSLHVVCSVADHPVSNEMILYIYRTCNVERGITTFVQLCTLSMMSEGNGRHVNIVYGYYFLLIIPQRSAPHLKDMKIAVR